MNNNYPTGFYQSYLSSLQQENSSPLSSEEDYVHYCTGDLPPGFQRYEKPMQREESDLTPMNLPFPTDKASLKDMLTE